MESSPNPPFIEALVSLAAAPPTTATIELADLALDTGERAGALKDAQGALWLTLALATDSWDPDRAADFHERLLRLAADTRFGTPTVGFIDPQRAAGLALPVPAGAGQDTHRLDALLHAGRQALDALQDLDGPRAENLQALLTQEAAWMRV